MDDIDPRRAAAIDAAASALADEPATSMLSAEARRRVAELAVEAGCGYLEDWWRQRYDRVVADLRYAEGERDEALYGRAMADL